MPSYQATWMKTIQQDLKSNTANLFLNGSVDITQNRSLRTLMSAFGAMHF